MAARLARLSRSVAPAYEGHAIAAFSHMHPIVAFVLAARQWPFAEPRQVQVPCGTIVHVRWDSEVCEVVGIDPRPTDEDRHGGWASRDPAGP